MLCEAGAWRLRLIRTPGQLVDDQTFLQPRSYNDQIGFILSAQRFVAALFLISALVAARVSVRQIKLVVDRARPFPLARLARNLPRVLSEQPCRATRCRVSHTRCSADVFQYNAVEVRLVDTLLRDIAISEPPSNGGGSGVFIFGKRITVSFEVKPGQFADAHIADAVPGSHGALDLSAQAVFQFYIPTGWCDRRDRRFQ